MSLIMLMLGEDVTAGEISVGEGGGCGVGWGWEWGGGEGRGGVRGV